MGEKRGKGARQVQGGTGGRSAGQSEGGNISTSLSQFPQAQLQKQPPCCGSSHCVSVERDKKGQFWAPAPPRELTLDPTRLSILLSSRNDVSNDLECHWSVSGYVPLTPPPCDLGVANGSSQRDPQGKAESV